MCVGEAVGNTLTFLVDVAPLRSCCTFARLLLRLCESIWCRSGNSRLACWIVPYPQACGRWADRQWSKAYQSYKSTVHPFFFIYSPFAPIGGLIRLLTGHAVEVQYAAMGFMSASLIQTLWELRSSSLCRFLQTLVIPLTRRPHNSLPPCWLLYRYVVRVPPVRVSV